MSLCRGLPDHEEADHNQVAAGTRSSPSSPARHPDGPLAMPDGELAPTRRTVDLSSVEVITVHGNKVTSIRSFSDSGALQRQSRLEP
jgi:hypothetical protein